MAAADQHTMYLRGQVFSAARQNPKAKASNQGQYNAIQMPATDEHKDLAIQGDTIAALRVL